MTTGIKNLVTTTERGQLLSIYSGVGNFAFEVEVVERERKWQGSMMRVETQVVLSDPARWAVTLAGGKRHDVGDTFHIYRRDTDYNWTDYWGTPLLVDTRVPASRFRHLVLAEIGSADWVNDLLGEE